MSSSDEQLQPMAAPGARWAMASAGLVFSACLVYTPASPHWLDCGELVAAAAGLGVLHPPGHPLVVLLAKAGSLLPLGPIAFRIALASALCLSLACFLVARIGSWAATRFFDLPPPLAGPVGAACALSAGWSGPVLLQGSRAEVYGANALLLIAALTALLGRPSPRRIGIAGLCVGLGLANHHYLIILGLLGPTLVTLGLRPRLNPAGLCAGLCGVVLGLGTYLLLPLRALRDPLVLWGDPRTAGQLGWVLSAEAFQKSLSPQQPISIPATFLDTFFVLMDTLGPWAALAGLVGLGLLIRRRARQGLILALGVPGVLLSKALMGFDPHNPDLHGYFLPAVLIMGAGAGVMGAFLLDAARAAPAPARRPLIGLVLALLMGHPLLQWQRHAEYLPDPQFDASRTVAAATLRPLPPHSIAVTASFDLIFALWAQRQSGGARPDVMLLHRPFLEFPGYRAQLLRQAPDTSQLLDGLSALQKGRLGCFPSSQRPLRVEAFHDLEPSCLRTLRAEGILTQPTGQPARGAAPPDPFWMALEARLLARATDSQTRRWLVWNHWLHGRLRVATGELDAAGYHLVAARRQAPRAAELDQLEAAIQRARSGRLSRP